MKNLNLTYTELKLGEDYTKDDLYELIAPNKRLTVPQIYVNNIHVGGYEDFVEYCDNHGLLTGSGT